jgi:hypothetical protein
MCADIKDGTASTTTNTLVMVQAADLGDHAEPFGDLSLLAGYR